MKEKSWSINWYDEMQVAGDYGNRDNRCKDRIVAIIRLGYKSSWEYGISCEDDDERCKMGFEEEKSTFEHYLKDCNIPSRFKTRGDDISSAV